MAAGNESESHLSIDALSAFARGQLDGAQFDAAEKHVLHCDSCCEALRTIDFSISVHPGAPSEKLTRPSSKGQTKAKSGSSQHGRFLPGNVISDRYRIVSLLGVGGMGEVYRADDLKLGQPVALKFLGAELTSDAALERLHAEVRLARNVSHPNVCRVYDIGEANDQHFISMEYIDGEDLKSLLSRIGRLPHHKGVEISRQLCAGLAAAHQQGILHRDLKPANIMIDGRGQVRITDFGLAMLDHVSANDIAGTPAYMAPEQTMGGESSVRSDVYSLGLVLAEIFTGDRMVSGSSIQEVRKHHETNATPKFQHELEPEIESTILQCLEKNAVDRPNSVASILATLPGKDPLDAVLAAGETPSPELLAASRKQQDRIIHPKHAVACLVTLLGGLAGLLLLPIGSLGGLIHSVDFPLEPAILAHKAREMVIASNYFGDRDPIWNSEAYGFVTNHGFKPHDQASRLRPHDAYHFWYRMSDFPLVPERRLSTKVSFDDPPPFRPGMAELRLDLHGRLIDFHATPSLNTVQRLTPTQWHEVFADDRTGMDFDDFTPTKTTRTPRTSAYNSLNTWQQAGVDEEEAMQLFAASLGNQIVACRVSWPLKKRDEPVTLMMTPIMDVTRIAIVLLIGLGVVLAPFNVRRGRSDRKGAFRIALCSVALTLLGWLFGASHTGYLAYDSQTLLSAMQGAVFVGCMAWCFYLALEPFVRRFWPHALITWTRLLRGDFFDRELGRDVLVGLSVAAACHVASKAWYQVLIWLQFEPRPFIGVTPDVILGPRAAVASLFDCALFAFIEGLFLLMFLFAIRLPMRVKGIAPVLFVLFFTCQFSLFSPEYTLIHLLMWAAAAALLTRFGLVALICFQFVRHSVEVFPMPADLSRWYAGYALIPIVLIAALGVFGYYTACGRRSLIPTSR